MQWNLSQVLICESLETWNVYFSKMKTKVQVLWIIMYGECSFCNLKINWLSTFVTLWTWRHQALCHDSPARIWLSCIQLRGYYQTRRLAWPPKHGRFALWTTKESFGNNGGNVIYKNAVSSSLIIFQRPERLCVSLGLSFLWLCSTNGSWKFQLEYFFALKYLNNSQAT